MPESLALSDILPVPEPPSSTLVSPHDIHLQPFCTQPSQDQEFASRYPASAPDNILPTSEALNDDEEDRDLLLPGMHKLTDSDEQDQQLVPPGQEHDDAQHDDHQHEDHQRHDQQDHDHDQQHHHGHEHDQHDQHLAAPAPEQQHHVPTLHHEHPRTPTPPAHSPEPGLHPHPHHHPHPPLDPGALHDGRRHHSVKKVEHQNSKANRRGPMDEMRQLVRILVKLMPRSMPFLKVDEAGGGNRVTEEDIKAYLGAVIGEAPQPKWGLPDGWGAYLSELFSWARSRPVGRQEAMRCARRLPGRSWEAVDEELARLGLCPSLWSLPLTFEGVKTANAGAHAPPPPAPIAAPPPAAAFTSGVRPLDPVRVQAQAHEEHVAAPKKKKARMSVQDQVRPLVPMATETECWYLALQFLNEAREKAGTTSASRSMELNLYQTGVRQVIDSLPRPASSSLQLNPVAVQATQQLLGNFQPREGAEHVLHQAQHASLSSLTIPGLGEHIYLPTVPVPVASLSQLGMQNPPPLPAFPNLPPLQPLLAQGRAALAASEPASQPISAADTNPAKPLRPTARSVQQLGIQAAGYQLMPPGSEASQGGKALIDSQKFLGGNGFAPYSGGAPRVSALEQQAGRPDPLLLLDSFTSLRSQAAAEASIPGADRQTEDPKQKLRGLLTHIKSVALNQQRVQGDAAMEALGLGLGLGLGLRPGHAQQGVPAGHDEAADCSDGQQEEAARASSAMPATAM